MATSYLVN